MNVQHVNLMLLKIYEIKWVFGFCVVSLSKTTPFYGQQKQIIFLIQSRKCIKMKLKLKLQFKIFAILAFIAYSRAHNEPSKNTHSNHLMSIPPYEMHEKKKNFEEKAKKKKTLSIKRSRASNDHNITKQVTILEKHGTETSSKHCIYIYESINNSHKLDLFLFLYFSFNLSN